MNAHTSQRDMLWSMAYPELSACSGTAIRDMLEHASQVEVAAGTQIMSPGAQCTHYLFVVRGRARVHVLTESGREISLYQVGPGDSCVLTTSCLFSHEPFPAGIVAETELLAFATGVTRFERAIDESPPFRRFVFRKFGERLVDVVSRMEQVCAPSIERYLVQTLLDLSGDGVTVATTHRQLAQRLGTAREVVSRHLKHFEVKGWVQLERGCIRIAEPEHLRRMIS